MLYYKYLSNIIKEVKIVYKALTIAEWLVFHSLKMNDAEFTHMKLQKLLYYMQGAFLALKDEPLFEDTIIAKQHGPVVPNVYNCYKKFGRERILPDVLDSAPENIIEADDSIILSAIYDIYGPYTASQLRNKSHSEQPWIATPKESEIKKDIIKQFFKEVFADVISGKIFEKIPIEESKKNAEGYLIYQD